MEMLASSALSIFDHMEPGALAYRRLSNEEATCTAPGHGFSQDFQTGCLIFRVSYFSRETAIYSDYNHKHV